MKTKLLIFVFASATAVISLNIWRQSDHGADHVEMGRLLAKKPITPSKFTANLVAGLPEPARRHLKFTITERAPLFTVAQIEMRERFSLGSKEAPN